jgi:hypothetical protein
LLSAMCKNRYYFAGRDAGLGMKRKWSVFRHRNNFANVKSRQLTRATTVRNMFANKVKTLLYPNIAKSLVFSGHFENIHMDKNDSETAFDWTLFLRNITQHFRINPSAAYITLSKRLLS